MTRRLVLLIIGAAAVVLVPWSVYLADTLPDRYATGQWRATWVGFDLALAACLAISLRLGLRRRPAAVPVLSATAALLFCDAWFDISLDWASSDLAVSVVLALLVEVPFGILLLVWARRLISGGMRHTQLTMRHLRAREDPEFDRTMVALDRLGPADCRTIAAAVGVSEAQVGLQLREAEQLNLVDRRRDGRWLLPAHQNLRLPSLEAARDGEDRERLLRFLDAKYRSELELLAWAVEHHAEFGRWGHGERAVTHLSGPELAAFIREYQELSNRYCLLRSAPGPDTREVAIRWYAFPKPADQPALVSVPHTSGATPLSLSR
ncbi:hypothetical protein ACPL_4957 [Actinoplanes sp. SE50/110]|uniref:hypothetical protein n=1 Tax=unclassified Actinoplanes TaxID=2626549 RepID=UPI00042E8D31|nr:MULTISPECIES: hypothetical protein [unclassified Actinoplanes]AEV85846.2 hypothetical protein ACPL_4957 [Actinoplanes sp. SE50/110]SLM01652.1 hypothetical protein ACSP50_4888 [Actinoplanes sp. SE50/110]